MAHFCIKGQSSINVENDITTLCYYCGEVVNSNIVTISRHGMSVGEFFKGRQSMFLNSSLLRKKKKYGRIILQSKHCDWDSDKSDHVQYSWRAVSIIFTPLRLVC